MKLKTRFHLWILNNHRDLFCRLKRLQILDISSDKDFFEIHAELVSDERTIQSLRERYNIYSLMKRTSGLEGAIAEVGVFQGGSAKLLCLTKGDSPLYLFDTFQGLPSFTPGSEGVFSNGDFNETSLHSVTEYLKSFKKVNIYKGIFPDTALGTPVEDMKFRFVHLDVDIHDSTLAALEFFYPRMVQSGIIISHDYQAIAAPGVRRAFDKFFKNKPEMVIPLWDTQCLITKS